MRIIEPIAGLPRITIRLRPTSRYGVPIAERSIGSNHISFRGADFTIRLTTDAPLSYIDREASFVLTKAVHLVMGPTSRFPPRCRHCAENSPIGRATTGWSGCGGCRSPMIGRMR